MAFFQLLGTGLTDVNPAASGRNRRHRATALMQHIQSWLLFDAPPDLSASLDAALSVTATFLTRLHPDVMGGLSALDGWLDAATPLLVPAPLHAQMAASPPPAWVHLQPTPLPPNTAFPLDDLHVTAVPTGPATFAFHIDTGKKRVTYAPHVVDLPEASASFFAGNDLLVLDAATWDRGGPGGRAFLRDLPALAVQNELVVATRLSPDAPPHAQAMQAVKRISHRAEVGFDLMKVPLGR